MIRYARCKGCDGVAEHDDDGHPFGWYSLSVNVPGRLGKNGKPFIWVGQWCSILCLLGDMDLLARQEELARMTYDADEPSPAGSPDAARVTGRVLRAVR